MKEKDNVYLHPSVARVHLSTGDLRLCKPARGVCVLAIISVWEKWMETTILPPFESPVLLPVVRGDHSQSHTTQISMRIFYVPAIHSWTYTLSILPRSEGDMY